MRYIFFILFLLLTSCSDKFVTMVKTQAFEPEWQFSESGKNNFMPAQVPGLVQTDLFRNGKIENPLFDKNELQLQWISEKDWVYKADFILSDSLIKYKAIDFIFEGLDTYAGIYLNDSLILSTDNMFLEWRVEGKKFLRAGKNTMKIVFYSPSVTGKKLLDKLSFTLPASDPVEPRISPFIRKAPYHFGWDWSPRFLTMGIWKPAKMVAHDKVYISDLHIRTIEIADTCAWLSADISIFSDKDLPNATVTVLDAFKQFKIKKGTTVAEVQFRIFNPELWWPNGYGKQKLYDLTAKLFVNAYLVDSAVSRAGIRTIELNQDEDEWGRSFYFRVNGLPIFMKGANYVPQSNFLTEVRDEDYTRLIGDAAAVGMNMLRVWGGGVYEKDLFYNLCDEKGILVWQDFMFAGSMVPGDSFFVKNVHKEAEYQVRRLRNHPSIALWCGNNEIEVAWNNWGWQQQFKILPSDSTTIYENYKTVFEQVIPSVLLKFDPNRPYISSSPLRNWGTKDNFNYGNMHYWGVWHGEEAIDSFRVNVPRFMTEYGMQSYPSFSALQKNTNEERITLNSEFIKNRQRSYKGNGLLNRYVDDYFGKAGNVEDLCYLSQLNQSEAMRIAIESHRKDARFCMGSLYWQLNDVWDGASWSTIEHSGKWKAAHYDLKRLYAHDLLISETRNDTTRIYFQTENTSGKKGELLVEVMDFRGRTVSYYNKEVSAGYLVADLVFEQPVNLLLGQKSKNEFFLKATITLNSQIIAETVHYFVNPVELKLSDPFLKYTVESNDTGATVIVTTQKLAKDILLEFENTDGRFSDNYFDLLPGTSRTITFIPESGNKITYKALKVNWYKPVQP